VARITLKVIGDRCAGDTYYVSVMGHLSERDLGRLENVCRRALEHRTPPLEIRVTDATAIDSDARTFLECLRARGAIVVDRRSGDKCTTVTEEPPTSRRLLSE